MDLSTLTADERESFAERAAILEYDAGLARHDAEHKAYWLVVRARDHPGVTPSTSAATAPASTCT